MYVVGVVLVWTNKAFPVFSVSVVPNRIVIYIASLSHYIHSSRRTQRHIISFCRLSLNSLTPTKSSD